MISRLLFLDFGDFILLASLSSERISLDVILNIEESTVNCIFRMHDIIFRDDNVMAETIARSCQNKADVVAADEKEADIRATLNLG